MWAVGAARLSLPRPGCFRLCDSRASASSEALVWSPAGPKLQPTGCSGSCRPWPPTAFLPRSFLQFPPSPSLEEVTQRGRQGPSPCHRPGFLSTPPGGSGGVTSTFQNHSRTPRTVMGRGEGRRFPAARPFSLIRLSPRTEELGYSNTLTAPSDIKPGGKAVEAFSCAPARPPSQPLPAVSTKAGEAGPCRGSNQS